MGVQPLLYAAVGEDVVGNDFIGPAQKWHGPATKVPRSKLAWDADAAKKLWAASAELTGVDYLQEKK